jgi:hypothetical protein
LQGENVHLDDLGPEATGEGKFHDQALSLTLRMGPRAFDLEAKLDKRSLTGTWRQDDSFDADHGTWSAIPLDTNTMAVLKEYRRLADNQLDYFIQSSPPPGYQPTGRELCKVWKAPNSVLALNWKAKSISMRDDAHPTNQPPVQVH